jgi:hypothetical protein
MTAVSPVPVQAMECIQAFIIPPLVVGFRLTEILRYYRYRHTCRTIPPQ